LQAQQDAMLKIHTKTKSIFQKSPQKKIPICKHKWGFLKLNLFLPNFSSDGFRSKHFITFLYTKGSIKLRHIAEWTNNSELSW
jgi:hypothetical protein